MTTTFFERALIWEKAKAAFDEARDALQRAGDALIETDFGDRHAGTNTKPLPDGRVVKCVAETEMKTDAEAAKACMAKLEALGQDGKLIAQRLFRWKPEVALSELKLLDKAMRKIADKAITPKPKRPSLSIDTPKA